MSEVISPFRSLRAESQLSALLSCFLCAFTYYGFGYEPGIAMHIALWNVVIVCHQYDVMKICWQCLYGGLSESGLCVFHKLCPVSVLEVGEFPSVLLSSVVMSYVDCGSKRYSLQAVGLSQRSQTAVQIVSNLSQWGPDLPIYPMPLL